MGKKKILFLCIAIFSVICYTQHLTKDGENVSGLALSNMEALANDAEIEGTNCNATMKKECCVCFGLHHTYAIPRTNTGACEHREGCSHYK